MENLSFPDFKYFEEEIQKRKRINAFFLQKQRQHQAAAAKVPIDHYNIIDAITKNLGKFESMQELKMQNQYVQRMQKSNSKNMYFRCAQKRIKLGSAWGQEFCHQRPYFLCSTIIPHS
jgi:hypothetical protein